MGSELLRVYDEALPQVYGYLLRRCEGVQVAEDLTAETFLAAVREERRGATVSVPWIIGVARHKLADHWRARARAGRDLEAVARSGGATEVDDPWDEHLDAVTARATLDALPAHYRAALALRYLDDLPVPDVAATLGLSVSTAEGLLARARAAFRRAYPTRDHDDA